MTPDIFALKLKFKNTNLSIAGLTNQTEASTHHQNVQNLLLGGAKRYAWKLGIDCLFHTLVQSETKDGENQSRWKSYFGYPKKWCIQNQKLKLKLKNKTFSIRTTKCWQVYLLVFLSTCLRGNGLVFGNIFLIAMKRGKMAMSMSTIPHPASSKIFSSKL